LAADCSGIMVIKLKDKRDVSVISSFHDLEMAAKSKGSGIMLSADCDTVFI
jgi:hypothetical protein